MGNILSIFDEEQKQVIPSIKPSKVCKIKEEHNHPNPLHYSNLKKGQPSKLSFQKKEIQQYPSSNLTDFSNLEPAKRYTFYN